jgi:hypothetical protein
MIRLSYAVFALPLLLCGCVTEPVGDFERKDASVFHDTILAGAGKFAAAQRGEPVSSYPLTDEEKELRDVAWDLVRPPHGGASWHADFDFTLQWSRLTPKEWYEIDANDFYVLLRNSGVVSHETYYELLINQARSDASRIPVFRDVAARVGKADGARRAAISALAANEAMRLEGEARIAENRHLVNWVEESMQYRIHAYRTALGRLMVEVPSTKAVEAEAAIDALQWEMQGSMHNASGKHLVLKDDMERPKPIRRFLPSSGNKDLK